MHRAYAGDETEATLNTLREWGTQVCEGNLGRARGGERDLDLDLPEEVERRRFFSLEPELFFRGAGDFRAGDAATLLSELPSGDEPSFFAPIPPALLLGGSMRVRFGWVELRDPDPSLRRHAQPLALEVVSNSGLELFRLTLTRTPKKCLYNLRSHTFVQTSTFEISSLEHYLSHLPGLLPILAKVVDLDEEKTKEFQFPS